MSTQMAVISDDYFGYTLGSIASHVSISGGFPPPHIPRNVDTFGAATTTFHTDSAVHKFSRRAVFVVVVGVKLYLPVNLCYV